MNNNFRPDKDIHLPSLMTVAADINQKFHLYDVSKDEVLYHYTSIDGFMSILENRDFWISNIRFMNDSQEFKNGCEICKKILQDRIAESAQKFGDLEEKYKAYYESLLRICNENETVGIFNISSVDIFALSFCEKGNLLTQWQVYGQSGVSIGLKNNHNSIENGIALMNEDQYNVEIKTMDQMNPHDEISFVTYKVIYDDKKKKELIKTVLQYGIDFIDTFPKDNVNIVVNGISDLLFYYFAIMKDKNFSHEQEKRLLIITNRDDSNVHFRIRKGVLIPYLKMKILNLNCRPHMRFPVEQIVIAPGPKQIYVAESIRYFLEKKQLGYLKDKIIISDIPFRD